MGARKGKRAGTEAGNGAAGALPPPGEARNPDQVFLSGQDEQTAQILSSRPHEIWPLERITRDPRNSRRHPAEQVERLRASLRKFGWTRPLLVDETGMLRVGHGMLQAAYECGMKVAPVVVLKGLTEDELRAYVIADNQLALGAEWDMSILPLELADLQGAGFDMETLGFGEFELKQLMTGREKEESGAGQSSTKEIDPGSFEFDHTCPRCGMGFDDE